MKKITMFVAAAMLMTAGVLSSCSSSKNVTSTAAGLNEERIAVAESKSQKLAAAKPDVRSSGIGNHFLRIPAAGNIALIIHVLNIFTNDNQEIRIAIPAFTFFTNRETTTHDSILSIV